MEKICIPPAVKNELFIKGWHYPSAVQLRKARFLEIAELKNRMLADAFTKELDEGESQVIALALETNPGLILLDEITVRMTAESYQIPFTGSIGCLVEAKRNRIISEIRPLLDEMRIKAGFWINPKLYQKILKDNDE